MKCSVVSCEKELYAKGLCRAHYYRSRRHGDPLAGRAPNGEHMRFIREVALPYKGDECLLWPFAKSSAYVQVMIEGRKVGAHRFVCQLAHGAPPTSEHEAAHSCGKGHLGCVSPNHLEWKTRSENQLDRVSHGTQIRGEGINTAKLTEDQVKEILRLKGAKTQAALAKDFNVSKSTISSIHVRRVWSWLEITQ